MLHLRYLVIILLLLVLVAFVLEVYSVQTTLPQAKFANLRVTTEVGGLNSRGLGLETSLTSNINIPISYISSITCLSVTCGLDGEMYIIDGDNAVRIVNVTDCDPKSSDLFERYVYSLSSTINYLAGHRLDVKLASPSSLAIHPISGDLYITQYGTNTIVQVSKITGKLTVVHGMTGMNPKKISFAPNNDLLIAESGYNRITRMKGYASPVLEAGAISQGVTTDGVDAKKALISGLASLEVAMSSGDIYYSETGKIRKITNSTVYTVKTVSGIDGHISLSSDESKLFYIANHQVYSLDLVSKVATLIAGATTTGVHSGDGGLATSASLISPKHVFMNKKGDLYISCSNVIRKVFSNGTIISMFGYPDSVGYKFSGIGLSKELVPIIGRPSIAINQSNDELFYFDYSRTMRRVSQSDGIVRKIIGVIPSSAEEATAPFVPENGPVGPNYRYNAPPSTFGILGNSFYIYKSGIIYKMEDYNYSTFLPASRILASNTTYCGYKPTHLIKYNETENTIYYVYDKKSIVKYFINTGKSEILLNEKGMPVVGTITDPIYRTNAGVYSITFATMNRKGEIFFFDSSGSSYSYIRKIGLDGYVSVLSGGNVADVSEVVQSSGRFSAYMYGLNYNEKTGDLIFADYSFAKIKKISGGYLRTVAGGGTSTLNNVVATSAKLGYVLAMTLTDNSEIIFHDSTVTSTGIVLKVIYSNGTLSFIQTSLVFNSMINSLFAKSIDEIYIAMSYQIVKLVNRNEIIKVAGTGEELKGFEEGDPLKGDGGNALLNKINPKSIDISLNGDIYIQQVLFSGIYYGSIQKISNGMIKRLIGHDTGPLCKLKDAVSTSFSSLSFSNAIYASDAGGLNRILKMDINSMNLTTVAGSGAGSYNGENYARMTSVVATVSVYVESSGELYFGETSRVRKVNSSGYTELIAGTSDANTFSVSTAGSIAKSTSIGTVSGIAVFVKSGVTYVYILSSSRISVVYNGMIYLRGGSYLNYPTQWIYADKFYKGGEGSDAMNALFEPTPQILVNSKGDLYMGEQGRIRKLIKYCENDYEMDGDETLCYWNCFSEMMNSTSACSSHGRCESPNNCICEQGYTGDQCEKIECQFGWSGDSCNITSCNNIMSDDLNVCSGNGKCYDFEMCNCTSGYSGDYCDSFSCFGIDQLSGMSCYGHGSCISIDTCQCQDGYFGNMCEIESCYGIRQDNSSVCSSNGQCTSLNNCKCNNGYSGQFCNITTCFKLQSTNSMVCSGNGKCILPDTCECNSNFTGPFCNVSKCYGIPQDNSLVCNGHGICMNNHSCQCYQGYFGENCSISSCYGVLETLNNVCSGNGQCLSKDVCSCHLGYFGNNCNVTSCYGIRQDVNGVCSGNGTCYDLNRCHCNDGYYGENCNVSSCFGIRQDNQSVCNGHGECTAMNQCQCNDGYYGRNCNITSCFGIQQDVSNVCSGNGTCIALNTCSCHTGYFGQNCSVISCYGIRQDNQSVCSSNGICKLMDNCQCLDGYFGNYCNITSCYGIRQDNSSVCYGHGECIKLNQCSCHNGYYGEYCNITSCYGIRQDNASVCSSNGQCIALDQCHCNSGYYGNYCNITSCYGIRQDNSSVCNGNGECNLIDTCHCKDGYSGLLCNITSCYGIKQDNVSVCNGNGHCIGFDQCLCNDGYYGQHCNVSSCYGVRQDNSLVCNGHGQCTAMNQCHCNDGYYGMFCNITSCFGIQQDVSNVCSGNGTCIALDYCSCNLGYYGHNCSIISCYGNRQDNSSVCSSNGICKLMDNCQCNDGYYGEYCNITSCYGIRQDNQLVCYGHGECIKLNQCSCHNGYYGEYCNITSCYGIRQDNSTVCSGNGTCTRLNQCHCNDEHYGEYCQYEIFKNTTTTSHLSNSTIYNETIYCFGIAYNNESVCSGNGTCISTNTCQCHYSNHSKWDAQCRILSNDSHVELNDQNKNSTIMMNSTSLKCFDKFANDSNVCSGRGYCISTDTCQCIQYSNKTLISGTECQNIYCHESEYSMTLQNSSTVCSSHGTCSKLGCKCKESYSGDACQIFSCFGVKFDNISVCSGNGNCNSLNNCTCHDGHYGNNCEFSIPNAITCFGMLNSNPNVCSKHGQCIDHNNCLCYSGYIGDSCSETICYDIPSSSNLVCSGNGQCLSHNQCKCMNGYTGDQCNIPICYNIMSNQSNVCSNSNDSNGSCIGPDTCQCHVGYTGIQCEIPICYGKLANDSLVCSENGKCSSPNTCECKQTSKFVKLSGSQCQYIQCLTSSNTFRYSTDKLVCNGRGTCSLNGCQCNFGYSGEYCQLFTCQSILFNQSNVCNGNGNCTDYNTCECYGNNVNGYWKGVDCENCRNDYESEVTGCQKLKCDDLTCNNHGICNSNLECVCNDHWDGQFCDTCKENYFKECQVYCSKSVTCSNNGDCTKNGTCSCYSNSQQGYWNDTDCSKCQFGYYGSMCSTRIIGPAKFLNMFNGIVLRIYGPISYGQLSVNCSRLISEEHLSWFGTVPICMWTDRNRGEFTILFGDDFTLTPGTIVKMNRLTFDSDGNEYENVQVLNADNPVIPVVIFSGQNFIGSCDNFILDATASYSGDRKELIYFWSIISSPQNSLMLNMTRFGSIVELDYNTLQFPGEYKFGLQVKSSISGMMSDIKTWTVNKTNIPLPILSIVGFKEISIYKSEIPLIIKKNIELPTCYFNNHELTINWEQTIGPNSTIHTDEKYNNLVVTQFSNLEESIYEFKVTATSVIDSQSTSSDSIKVIVKPSPLSLILYSDEVTFEKGSIVVNFVDPDMSIENERWIWSCIDLTNNIGCGEVIDKALKSQGDDQLDRIEIASLDLQSYTSMPILEISLTIIKGIRQVSKALTFSFPERKKIPPTVSLISILPTKSIILKQDIVNLQLAVTANGQSIGIDQFITREWSLNSILLLKSNSLLSKMDTDPSMSNSIVIDPSLLEDGSINIVTLKVTDNRNSLTASYSHTFTMATRPQPCPCTILPSNGIALETSFSFTCINCQNSQKSLEVVYGFIDDKSGANIPLYQKGETYSTKLPCSYTPLTNKIVETFIRITDTLTGAYSEIRKDIVIELAPAKTVTEVKKKVAGYSSIQNSLKDGDTAKMVFNSATISRVANGMLTRLSGGVVRRRISHQVDCKNGGKFNEEKNQCECAIGYYKKDCSVNLDDFQAIKEIRLSLMMEFINTFEARNVFETISETYLTLQTYGLDSLIEEYDEIDEMSIEKTYSILNTLLTLCENNKNLRVPYGVDKLFTNIVNSIYGYLTYSQTMNDRLIILINMLKKFSSLMLRGLFIGSKDLQLVTNFVNLSTNKLFKSSFESKSTSPMNGHVVNLPYEMPLYLNEKSNRKPISFISLSLKEFNISNNFNNQLTRNITMNTNKNGTVRVETSIYEMKHVRSNILLFELIDSTISSEISSPIQYQLTPYLSDVKNYGIDTLIYTNTSNDQQVVTKVYRTSEFSCQSTSNFTLIDYKSVCTLQLNYTPTMIAICKCSSMIGVFLVENIIEKRITSNSTNSIILSPNITNNPNNPNDPNDPISSDRLILNQDNGNIVMIIGIIISIIACCVVLSLLCIILGVLIWKKCHKKEKKEEFEMISTLELSHFTV